MFDEADRVLKWNKKGRSDINSQSPLSRRLNFLNLAYLTINL